MIEIDPQTWLEQQQGRSESSFSSRTAPAQLIGVHEALAQQDMPQLILSGLLIVQSLEGDSATAILPEYSSITYTQSELSVQLRTDGSLVTVWKGSHSTQEPNGNIVLGVATLVQQPNGDIFANFGTETSAFNLLKLSSSSEVGEYYQIQETRWSDIGNEADEEATMDTEDTSGRSDPGQEPAEPSPTVFLAGSTTVPGTVETFTAVKDSSVSPITTADSSNRDRQRLRKRRDLQDTSNPEITIDVLVVVTFRAMCESSGQNDLNTCQLNDSSRSSMEGKLAVTVAETNTGLAAADTNAKIRITRIDYLGLGSFDGVTTETTLRFLRDDPAMQQARLETRSDLVSILTGGGGSGVAYLNGFVSAVSQAYIPFYTFQHELMHCLGANHDRDHSSGTQHPYGHGYQVPATLRTVMAYRCEDGADCPRIPFLSANGYQHNGVSIGDASHDNARLVRENVLKVSQYYVNEDAGDGAIDTESVNSFDFFKPFLGLFALCFAG